MIYKVKNGFIVRKIGSQIMAVPVGQQTSELHGMIALTESAELLWRSLKDGATVETLVHVLTKEYDVDPEIASTDVEHFLQGLKEQGALE